MNNLPDKCPCCGAGALVRNDLFTRYECHGKVANVGGRWQWFWQECPRMWSVLVAAREQLDKAVKTRDGVPIRCGMQVWYITSDDNDVTAIETLVVAAIYEDEISSKNHEAVSMIEFCYSTREAAESARLERTSNPKGQP